MDLHIDVAGAEPVYEQIVRQVLHGVRDGALAQGAPLPPIRQLARDLELNQNTVAKAYKILEGYRVIRTAGHKGTFIDSDALRHVASHDTTQALHRMQGLVASLREDGLSDAQIDTAFRAALAAN